MTRLRLLLPVLLVCLFCGWPGAGRSQQIIAPEEPIRSREQASELYEQANALYGQKEYRQAFALYQRLHRAGYGSREVLGNAGNAAYRLGDVGTAVLYYRRALEADPNYRAARDNLNRIEPETNRLEDRGLGAMLADWFHRTPGWIWLLVIEAAFVWLLVALYLLGRTEPRTEGRSLWWSRLAGSVVLVVLAGALAGVHEKAAEVSGEAVVVQERAVTRTGPGESFFQQLELPAGTVVDLVSAPEEGWVRVKLLDGRSGYVTTDAVELI